MLADGAMAEVLLHGQEFDANIQSVSLQLPPPVVLGGVVFAAWSVLAVLSAWSGARSRQRF
jgi:hypothetical protein